MPKKESRKLYKRHWLNEDKGSGYIIIDAEATKTNLDAGVEIKDCNRQITLDFWAWDEEEYQKGLKKIRSFIELLEELETFMKENPVVKKKRKAKTKILEAVEELTEALDESKDNVVLATATLRPTTNALGVKDETE